LETRTVHRSFGRDDRPASNDEQGYYSDGWYDEESGTIYEYEFWTGGNFGYENPQDSYTESDQNYQARIVSGSLTLDSRDHDSLESCDYSAL
jgi:hypothetical protein